MTERTIVLGGIVEPFHAHPETQRIVALHNQNVMAKLPLVDKNPSLNRSFFAQTQIETQYKSHGGVIHFGAVLDLTDFKSIWMSKLESLLRELVWVQAWLHMDAAHRGVREQLCFASDDIAATFLTQSPLRTTKWSVEIRTI